MKFSKLLLSFFLVFFALSGLGCKGLSQTEQASIKPVSLSYWTVFNDVDQLKALAAEYKKLYPYISISIKQVRYEEFDKLFINALADDVQPDIISVHSRWINKYLNRIAPAPASVTMASASVQGKISKETIVTTATNLLPTANGIKSNFIRTVYEDAVVGGKIYGIPLSVDDLAIYYNKNLLDKAGIATPPATWAEILGASQKTTKVNNDGKIIQTGIAIGTGKNVDNAGDILAMLMMQNKVEVADGANITFANTLKNNLEGNPALEALRFYTDFARPTKEAYTWNDKLGNSLDAFIAGRAVFYIGYSFDYQRIISRAPQMNLEIIPLPQLDSGNPVNVANYWVESVVEKSKNKNIAWDFVRFMTTADNLKKYNAGAKRLSPLRGHIKDQMSDEVLAPFLSSLLNAENWYKGKDIDTANTAMKNLITSALEPYGESEEPAERDAKLLINAASVIQQTM
jgi:multiple sugar transport system substrate-binding protein